MEKKCGWEIAKQGKVDRPHGQQIQTNFNKSKFDHEADTSFDPINK